MVLDIVIVGCGGHGRELLEIVRAINRGSDTGPVWQVRGFVDDGPTEVNQKRIRRLGVAYLGPLTRLADLAKDTHIALGIGEPQQRRMVTDRIDGYRLPVAVLVHPAATMGADARYGEGLVLFAGARVTTNVTLGRHVHLNQNATVAHDCVLGDHVSVNPLAGVSGNCHLGNEALVGAGAVVLPDLRVGSRATIGAGACVVRDVPADTVVKGVPAR